MVRRILFAVLIGLLGAGAAQASQSIYPNSGGTFTVGTAIGSNIALAAAPISNGGGTLSFHCQITSTSITATLEQWSCSSGAFSLTATDGSQVTAIFSTGSLSFAGSSFNGYSYQFNGSFIGTLKKGTATTAISGATTQYINGLQAQLGPQGAPVTGGTTGVNSLLGPLYIADFNNARIVRSDDLFGTNLTTYHGSSTSPSHFYGPAGITVDALENIYVTDSIACRVAKLQDMTGLGLTTLGSCGSGTNQFSSPAGIALDSSGRIYVADSGNNRIVRMDDLTGTNWTMLGTVGNGVGEFSNPLDVAVDAAGHIYVADSGNNRVVRMDDMKGTNWTTLTKGTAASQVLTRPSGLSLDSAGRLYIADSGLLVRVDNMTGLNWASFLTGDATNYVSVDPSGTIYVTGGAITRVDDLAGAGWTTSGLVANALGVHATGAQLPIGSLALTPKSLTFGLQRVDTASKAQIFTLTNQGTGPLKIESVTAPAGFTLDNTCPASLIAGTSCSVSAAFIPTKAEAYTGAVVFKTNGQNPTVTAAVSGTGELPPAVISVKPLSLNFGTQLVKTTSLAQTVTIANTGGQPMTLALSVTASYLESTTCEATLAAGASCLAYVEFSPTVTGSLPGSLTIANNTATPTVTVTLKGIGGATPGILTMTPSNLNFGPQLLNTSSAPKIITVKNIGGSTLNLTGLAITGPFTVDSTCGTSLDAGATCTLSIIFSPVSLGATTGGITLTNNDKPLTVTTTFNGSGTATTGVLTVSAKTLSFGTLPVGATSAPLPVKLSNTGTGPVALTALLVAGAFNETSNCPPSLAAGASCTIGVTFKPTATGPTQGSLTIADNTATTQFIVILNGTGSSASTGTITLSPTSLIFTSQLVGSTSAPQKVTVTNTGSAALALSGFTVAGAFAEKSTCPTSLPMSASCTVSVTFTPKAAGAATGTLTIANSSSTPQATIALKGTAFTSTGGITVSPSALTFASQVVGATSAALMVTVANSSSAAITLSSFSVAGPFAETNTCPATLAAAASCTVKVTFSPTATGAAVGSLAIANSGPSPQVTVQLSGQGSLPFGGLTMTPAALTFTPQLVSTTSAAQIVRVANTSISVISIASVTISGPFAETTTCGAILAPAASCTVSVTFTPAAAGAAAGTLTIANGSPTPNATVSLSGKGTAPTGGITLYPGAITFYPQAVGTTSTAHNIKVTNTSSLAISLTGFTVVGPFGETTTCGASLAPGQSCTVAITFAPVASGVAAGTLAVANSGVNSPVMATLAGTGAASKTSALVFSPATLTFGKQVVATPSAAKTIRMTNTGTGQVNLWNISTTGGFNQTNNCGTGLAAGASCLINVSFEPSATGAVTGQLQVSNNSATPQADVDLYGTGTAPTAWLALYSLNFPTQLMNTISGPQSILLGNSGSGVLSVTNISVTGPFQISTNCGVTVAVNSYCLIAVTFNPNATGLQSGTLTIADNDAGYPASQTVQLSGTGSATIPAYSINPGGLLFLPRKVGTVSPSQNIVVTNNGSAPLPIQSISINGADFSQTNTCSGSVAANSSCVVAITFTPAAKGTRSGAASISVGSGNGFAILLTGIGD